MFATTIQGLARPALDSLACGSNQNWGLHPGSQPLHRQHSHRQHQQHQSQQHQRHQQQEGQQKQMQPAVSNEPVLISMVTLTGWELGTFSIDRCFPSAAIREMTEQAMAEFGQDRVKCLAYKDEDGDLCMIRRVTFSDALQFARPDPELGCNVLKVIVQLREPQTDEALRKVEQDALISTAMQELQQVDDELGPRLLPAFAESGLGLMQQVVHPDLLQFFDFLVSVKDGSVPLAAVLEEMPRLVAVYSQLPARMQKTVLERLNSVLQLLREEAHREQAVQPPLEAQALLSQEQQEQEKFEKPEPEQQEPEKLEVKQGQAEASPSQALVVESVDSFCRDSPSEDGADDADNDIVIVDSADVPANIRNSDSNSSSGPANKNSQGDATDGADSEDGESIAASFAESFTQLGPEPVPLQILGHKLLNFGSNASGEREGDEEKQEEFVEEAQSSRQQERSHKNLHSAPLSATIVRSEPLLLGIEATEMPGSRGLLPQKRFSEDYSTSFTEVYCVGVCSISTGLCSKFVPVEATVGILNNGKTHWPDSVRLVHRYGNDDYGSPEVYVGDISEGEEAEINLDLSVPVKEPGRKEESAWVLEDSLTGELLGPMLVVKVEWVP